jgi:hypothetical protein
MNLNERIIAFAGLGIMIRECLEGIDNDFSKNLSHLIDNQQIKNEWFTPVNVRMSLQAISEVLTIENLTKWTDSYPELTEKTEPLNIAVIMAGNIPLVGFHDFLSVLLTGNSLLAKTSSKDSDLIIFISEVLNNLNPGFKEKIKFVNENLSGFDAVIATGSDNSSRYFESYFGKYPNIIRKNRNSVAILDGNESGAELKGLGKDIFSYFGLGCRNVSKIFVPRGYDFSFMICNWELYAGVINHRKYANNYDFSKAVYLVNRDTFTDTGFLLLTEKIGLASPVAVVYFEYYDSLEKLMKTIEQQREKIQCIVGKNHTPFGKAQSPDLWDYADGIDTIDFILKKIRTRIL